MSSEEQHTEPEPTVEGMASGNGSEPFQIVNPPADTAPTSIPPPSALPDFASLGKSLNQPALSFVIIEVVQENCFAKLRKKKKKR